MTAGLGDSLLAKAVSCAVSVVKAERVQGGATTNILVNQFVTFLFGCMFGKMIMILPRLKE